MISNALRTDIEAWAARRHENALMAAARSGRLTAEMVTRYIANVTHMIRLTVPTLKLAIHHSRLSGDEPLARHYELKLAQEDGHVVWGESDLETLMQLSAAPDTSVTPAFRELYELLVRSIERDPSTYLCYVAFTEYVTVLVGPEFLEVVEKSSGVSRSSMTVIDKHIELDRHHAEEGFGVFDDLVTDPRKVAMLRAMLKEICDTFDRGCLDVTTAAPAAAESGIRVTAGESESRIVAA